MHSVRMCSHFRCSGGATAALHVAMGRESRGNMPFDGGRQTTNDGAATWQRTEYVVQLQAQERFYSKHV